MKKTSFHVLRVGMGITFLWIGVLIFQDPNAWGSYVQPWVINLLPFPIETIMFDTAILDVVIGALLIFDTLVWLAAFVGMLHLVSVLAVSGINEATVRDIAIVAGTFSLFVDSVPAYISKKIMFWKKEPTYTIHN